jgi:hypothetical protein
MGRDALHARFDPYWSRQTVHQMASVDDSSSAVKEVADIVAELMSLSCCIWTTID